MLALAPIHVGDASTVTLRPAGATTAVQQFGSHADLASFMEVRRKPSRAVFHQPRATIQEK